MSRRPRATIGFTLMELMVVVGIAMVLLAISVPVAKNIAAGNALARCNTQLQQIGQALKIYHLDYGAVPPRYPLNPADSQSAVDGDGLEALWRTDYLHNRKALHCPRDLAHGDASDPIYYESYSDRDECAKPGNPIDPDNPTGEKTYDYNQYKYLSYRGITYDDYVAGDGDYYRQLADIVGWAPPDPVTGKILPIFNTDWHPDDTTVVTWCNWHTDTIKRGGEPQYLVLFWDGSVSSMPARLFTDPADGPPAAWRVRPSDELP